MRYSGNHSVSELDTVLSAYDARMEWPQGTGTTYTQFFFRESFDDGFRFKNCAPTMWECFKEWGYKKKGHNLEVPMQHIARAVEYMCRMVSDRDVGSDRMKDETIVEAIRSTEYQAHMQAVSFALQDNE
jgi:hypothetical protein